MAKNQQIPKKGPAAADERGKPRKRDGNETGQPATQQPGEAAGIINRQRTLLLMLLLVLAPGYPRC